jgi:hypothetical protein
MSQKICVLCQVPLTSHNDSQEHVIPSAIGGRLKVSGFICQKCNSKSGETWDAKLAAQLNPLALMLGVTRDRGAAPSKRVTTTAGEKLLIKSDGGLTLAEPSYTTVETADGLAIQMTARTMREARKMLAGAKRKFPNLDIGAILASAEVQSAYPDGMIHHQINFGGEVSGRSIVKTALALAHYAGIPWDRCQDAINYLRHPTAEPCFGYYQVTDLIENRPEDTALHCVCVVADPVTGMVLAYLEYFGVQKIVACLGRSYSGPSVTSTYAIDPRTGAKLDLAIKLAFTPAEIQAIYDHKMLREGAMEEAFRKIMPGALQRQFESERERVIKSATEYAFANCGAKEGEILTEEHVAKLADLMMEKLEPWLVRHIAWPPRSDAD